MATTNPHAPAPLSPLLFMRSCWAHRDLLFQLTWRDISQRFKGTILGLHWSLLSPLLMLLVYTFFFSVVMKVSWGNPGESKADFAVVLYAGLSVYNLFAEMVNRSPRLILENAGYVKRVVFPLEMLALVSAGSALFNFSIQLLILLMALICINGSLPITVLAMPLVLLPLVLFSLSMTWLLASLGVFLRDIGPLVALITSALIFLSPVFYSLHAVPSDFRQLIELNPMTFVIDEARAALIWGESPDWQRLALHSVIQASLAWAGYCWFQITRRGFADVL